MQANIENQEGFTVTNDQEAEWALRKIATAETESNRLAYTCDLEIQRYKTVKQESIDRCARDTAYLRALLERYFESVPRKKAKTQETYKLPSGVLKRKNQAPSFERDEASLLAWAKARPNQPFVKVVETTNWAEIKAACAIAGDAIADENGEIVPGVKVVSLPPVFYIECKGGETD